MSGKAPKNPTYVPPRVLTLTAAEILEEVGPASAGASGPTSGTTGGGDSPTCNPWQAANNLC